MVGNCFWCSYLFCFYRRSYRWPAVFITVKADQRFPAARTALGASGGYGYAYALGFASLFALVHGEGSYVGEKLHKSKFAYGSDQGVLFDLTDNFKFQTSIEWRAYPWSESRFINEMRFSNARYGLGLYHQAYLSDGLQDLGIRMLFYF